jgi:hypothetical protein
MVNTIFIGYFFKQDDNIIYIPNKDFLEAGKFKFTYNEKESDE